MVQLYENAFRVHGDSPKAVLWPKGRQEERFSALTKHIHLKGGFSILDYGCGLAHLKPFLDNRYNSVEYAGVDSVPAFVNAASAKYSGVEIFQLSSPEQLQRNYDFVVASGVFNICYLPDMEANQAMVFKMLQQLFSRANIYLSVNFMTNAVDYQQEGAYHQNASTLYEFVCENLSRRLVLDQSYMPYEYTVTMWKNQNIHRPENLYANF
jgi:trans-aconitate methyltransferase